MVLGLICGEQVFVPSHRLFCFSACQYCLCGSENLGSYIVSIVEIIKILKSSCRTEKLKSCVFKNANQYHVKGIQAMGQPNSALPPELVWVAAGLAAWEVQGPHSGQVTALRRDSCWGKGMGVWASEFQSCQRFPVHPQDLWVVCDPIATLTPTLVPAQCA